MLLSSARSRVQLGEQKGGTSALGCLVYLAVFQVTWLQTPLVLECPGHLVL